ncbi:LamG-like jellyroll fold domain-containing protein [Microbacterium sp. SLBN-111]|uniref:LamG-like jellyroll fold domain-containing protein n=1 Tax=Microbacterium sp. SLBN-111 TaxID=3377733 RepID=UPI003C72279F
MTDDEKMAFVEGYERGEPIADLATKLGVHRTTLDNLIRRLELTREDPDAVPPAVRDEIVASYRAGETLASVGGRHGFSSNKVQRLLVAAREPIRARGPRKRAVTSERLREIVARYKQGEAIEAARDEAAVTNTPVVVEELTTATEQTKALPNGSMGYEVSTVPVRTERSEGEWVPIDTNLVLRDGWWEPQDSARPVRFSAGGTDELTQIRTEGGEWLTETWAHGALPEPVIDGSNATYPNVFEDVDLRLTATELGMASVYVVRTPQAAASHELTDLAVELEGAAITRESTGEYIAETATGDTITAASPLWWDSSGGGTAEGPGLTAGAMGVDHSADATSISLDVGATVEGTAPQYPVFIDPDWNTGQNAGWYTDDAYPGEHYLNQDTLGMGRYGQYNGDAFFEFRIAALAGKQILNAQMSTTQLAVAAWPNNPVRVRLFGHQDAGFNRYQQNNSLWGPQQGGSQSPGTWQGPAVTVGWGVTDGVRARVGGEWVQFGLSAEDPNASQSRRHFSRAATLYVSYNTPPDTPTNLRFVSPNRSCGTSQAQAYISATSVTVGFNQTDPDPGNVDTNVYLYRTGESTPVQQRSPGLGAQGAKSVTFTDLQDGQSYAWIARGSDWIIDGTSFSAWCGFEIDRTGPSVPTLTPPTTALVVGKSASVTLANPASDRVAFVAYALLPAGSSSGFVFDVFASPPACGSTVGTVRIACPNASGVTTISVTPTESVSTLVAIPYDVAGNPGVVPGAPAGQAGTVGASYRLTASNDPQVSFASGNVWLTQAQEGPLDSRIPSTKGWDNSSLILGLDASRRLSANPLSPTSPLKNPVLGFHDPSGLKVLDDDVSAVISVASTGSGAAEVWSCVYNGAQIVGSAALCTELSGASNSTLLGYTWTSAELTPGRGVPLIVCRAARRGGDVYMTSFTPCPESIAAARVFFVEQLGYVSPSARTAGPTTRSDSASAVNFNASFTAAAWLKPGSGTAAALSTSVSGAGMSLGSSSTSWRFCLRPSPSGTQKCVTTARQSTSVWTHVAGVWDAGNNEMRLFINGQKAATVSYSWPSGTTLGSAALDVGATLDGSSVVSRWTGQIADPAVFAGVATSSQLSVLRTGQDPLNG